MMLGEVYDTRLEPVSDPIGDALTEHHGDNIRIGTQAIRQDRGICRTQSGQAVHMTVLVYDPRAYQILAPSCRCRKGGTLSRRCVGATGPERRWR